MDVIQNKVQFGVFMEFLQPEEIGIRVDWIAETDDHAIMVLRTMGDNVLISCKVLSKDRTKRYKLKLEIELVDEMQKG